MIYVLGRQLFNEEVGLVAALILALSSFNIQYSQEARMSQPYGLAGSPLHVLLHTFLTEEHRCHSAGYVVSTTLLLYTHIYATFVVIAQNVYLLTLLFLSREHAFRLDAGNATSGARGIFRPLEALARRQRQGCLDARHRSLFTHLLSTLERSSLLALFIGLSLLSLFAYHQKCVAQWIGKRH